LFLRLSRDNAVCVCVFASYLLRTLLMTSLLSPFQSQRSAVEHQKIPEESAAGVSLWRRPTRHHAMVDELVVAHRLAATERGHGLGASEYPSAVLKFIASLTFPS
jgi:hypothetical protein